MQRVSQRGTGKRDSGGLPRKETRPRLRRKKYSEDGTTQEKKARKTEAEMTGLCQPRHESHRNNEDEVHGLSMLTSNTGTVCNLISIIEGWFHLEAKGQYQGEPGRQKHKLIHTPVKDRRTWWYQGQLCKTCYQRVSYLMSIQLYWCTCGPRKKRCQIY